MRRVSSACAEKLIRLCSKVQSCSTAIKEKQSCSAAIKEQIKYCEIVIRGCGLGMLRPFRAEVPRVQRTPTIKLAARVNPDAVILG